MPHAIAACQQHIARLQLGDQMHGHGRVAFRAQAAYEDVGVRVVAGLGLGQLAAIDQGLDIGMIRRAVEQPPALEVVNA